MEQQQPQTNHVAVVMVPGAAQGHLNPMLHLARLISSRGDLPVHFIGSATHIRQVKDRVQASDPSTISNIHFHDFQLPELLTTAPDPHSSDKFPNHLMPVFEAAAKLLQEPLAELLQALSCTYRRVVVVHDYGLYFAIIEQLSRFSKAEAYCMHTFSAATLLYLHWEASGEDIIPEDLPRVLFDGAYPEFMLQYAVLRHRWGQLDVGEIYNTCDAIEGRFIDMLAQLRPNKKHWAMGPFYPIAGLDSSSRHHQCLNWLDKYPKDSVIYVSFGTTTSMSDEQVAEIATGLEQSGQNFIWVIRDADRGDIYKEKGRQAQLPIGFEDRMKEVGIVVRDWAPQLNILSHPAIGGFMSHCGWNSCLESMSMGVPIAAWPMHGDQPTNAILVTEVLKAGLVVRDWARRGEVISSDIIKTSIKKLMASEEGDMLRKRANELGIAVRGSVSETGSSMTQLESFITHIRGEVISSEDDIIRTSMKNFIVSEEGQKMMSKRAEELSSGNLSVTEAGVDPMESFLNHSSGRLLQNFDDSLSALTLKGQSSRSSGLFSLSGNRH